MRLLILAAAALSVATPALAQTAANAAASAPAAAAKYNTSETELGVLLDNPAAKAILEKHIPGMTSSDQVDMARAMTLKAVQQYAPDDVTDARLAAIDAELAKLP